MKNRFTRKSRTERDHIPKKFKKEIYERDGYICVYCKRNLNNENEKPTLDHLIPISTHSGLNEKTNFVTSCLSCNQKKANMSIKEFAEQINIKLEDLPITGDLIIDNTDLPKSIRQIRKEVFDKIRNEELLIGGKHSQKKIEKKYRENLINSKLGQELKNKFPSLPGPVRSMIPEIETIASNKNDFNLLVELAKSANTRNLIGTIIIKNCNIMDTLINIIKKSNDKSLVKRINFAITRYKKNRK